MLDFFFLLFFQVVWNRALVLFLFWLGSNISTVSKSMYLDFQLPSCFMHNKLVCYFRSLHFSFKRYLEVLEQKLKFLLPVTSHTMYMHLMYGNHFCHRYVLLCFSLFIWLLLLQQGHNFNFFSWNSPLIFLISCAKEFIT